MLKKRFVEMVKGIDFIAVGIAVIIATLMFLMILKIANTSYIATVEQPNGTVKQLEVSTYNIDDGTITLFAKDGERLIVGAEKCSIRKVK
jgi:hypothetical protein